MRSYLALVTLTFHVLGVFIEEYIPESSETATKITTVPELSPLDEAIPEAQLPMVPGVPPVPKGEITKVPEVSPVLEAEITKVPEAELPIVPPVPEVSPVSKGEITKVPEVSPVPEAEIPKVPEVSPVPEAEIPMVPGVPPVPEVSPVSRDEMEITSVPKAVSSSGRNENSVKGLVKKRTDHLQNLLGSINKPKPGQILTVSEAVKDIPAVSTNVKDILAVPKAVSSSGGNENSVKGLVKKGTAHLQNLLRSINEQKPGQILTVPENVKAIPALSKNFKDIPVVSENVEDIPAGPESAKDTPTTPEDVPIITFREANMKEDIAKPVNILKKEIMLEALEAPRVSIYSELKGTLPKRLEDFLKDRPQKDTTCVSLTGEKKDEIDDCLELELVHKSKASECQISRTFHLYFSYKPDLVEKDPEKLTQLTESLDEEKKKCKEDNLDSQSAYNVFEIEKPDEISSKYSNMILQQKEKKYHPYTPKELIKVYVAYFAPIRSGQQICPEVNTCKGYLIRKGTTYYMTIYEFISLTQPTLNIGAEIRTMSLVVPLKIGTDIPTAIEEVKNLNNNRNNGYKLLSNMIKALPNEFPESANKLHRAVDLSCGLVFEISAVQQRDEEKARTYDTILESSESLLLLGTHLTDNRMKCSRGDSVSRQPSEGIHTPPFSNYFSQNQNPTHYIQPVYGPIDYELSSKRARSRSRSPRRRPYRRRPRG